ncbi:MAG: hypothetical protein IE933_11465 [Sphingomonadales bacterium]|nr:hypothetical protein [Sphingomonadales bacterium]MBD3773923.1 hypothetical protein [Paracoccaceae bacterium]
MPPFRILFAALLLGLALPLSAPLAAQTKLENPDGPWTHPASGTVFPLMLGDAERMSVTAYDEQQTDVSAGYSLRSDKGAMVLTIYVYPVPEGMTCADLYAEAQSAINRYSKAQLLSEGSAPSPSGATPDSAKRARYMIPAGSIQPDIPQLVSDLYLSCPSDTGFAVKYRASWNGSAADFPDVQALMRQVAWPFDLR